MIVDKKLKGVKAVQTQMCIRDRTMSGEQLLVGNGSVTHKQAVDKATTEYRKYKVKTLSDVEQDYLNSIKFLEQKTGKK